MKRTLMIFGVYLISLTAQAQWTCISYLTFDPGDVLYPVAISIDTDHYHHNIWQVGKPDKTVFTSALSLPNAIVTDTLNPYPLNDTSVFILKFPKQLTFGNPLVYFQFWYQLQKDTGSIAKLEISIDSGTHWINEKDALPSFFSWPAGDTANLSLSTIGWTSFRLYACMGCPLAYDTILFRFTFISDSVLPARDGWIIDNINLDYYCEGAVTKILHHNSITISPNPTFNALSISSSEPISQITITNLLGQTLLTRNCSSDQVEIDVSDLPAGVYLIKINGTDIRKFVKQ